MYTPLYTQEDQLKLFSARPVECHVTNDIALVGIPFYSAILKPIVAGCWNNLIFLYSFITDRLQINIVTYSTFLCFLLGLSVTCP